MSITKHVSKNLIYFKDVEHMTFKEISNMFSLDSFFVYDTESCRHEKEMERERVYAWALGSTFSDTVVYGYFLDDFFKFTSWLVDKLNEKSKCKNIKKLIKNHTIEIFCHNLGWDLEFSKYTLDEMGFKLHKDLTNNNELERQTQESNSFSITENNNIVYGSTVCIEGNKCKNTLVFNDSYKIMSKKLDDIGREVIKIDEMFYKMGSEYDYEKIRPLDHVLSILEKNYLYNDIYILKEFIKQFYIPINTKQKTASGIAFEFFLETKYGQGANGKNYKAFENDYPVINNPVVRDIIKNSYTGGFTQANRNYVGQDIEKYGVSIDINSSYPSVIHSKPLPQGLPNLIEGKPRYDSNYQNAILTIEFDGFKNKDIFDQIGKIKCSAKHSELFKLGGNEYLNSNFIENVPCGGNGKSKKHLYQISIWDFELKLLLKTMNFYTYELTECEYTGNIIKGDLKKGYIIKNSLMFRMTTGFFKQGVELCMKQKIEGKETGNACLTEFAKLKMNSFYGKCGATDEREIRDLVKNDDGIFSMTSCNEHYLTNRKYYKAFASCVTAWGRCNLIETMYKIGVNNVVYFDTDSLYTLCTVEQIKESGIDLHPTKLGAWDIEKEYTKIKSIGAKKYIALCRSYGKKGDYKIMCKCAGLPSDVRNTINFESFFLGNIFEGKKSKRKVLGGYRLTTGSFELNKFSWN